MVKWVLGHWTELTAVVLALYSVGDVVVRWFIPTAKVKKWEKRLKTFGPLVGEVYRLLNKFYSRSR